MPTYEINNWAHFVLCSNSGLALRIEREDRRFLVPTVTEQKQPPEFWEKLHNWLESGGYAIIAQWARDFVGAPNAAVRASADAPGTLRKGQMIEDSRSIEERLVIDLAVAVLASAEAGQGHIVLAECDVTAWLRVCASAAHRKGAEAQAPSIRQWLQEGGLFMSDRLTIDRRKQRAFGTFPLEGRGWTELSRFRTDPGDFKTM
jgi:hypothetical protein